jgi:hypothetical protein
MVVPTVVLDFLIMTDWLMKVMLVVGMVVVMLSGTADTEVSGDTVVMVVVSVTLVMVIVEVMAVTVMVVEAAVMLVVVVATVVMVVVMLAVMVVVMWWQW